MVRPRTTVYENPFRIGTRDNAIKLMIKKRTAAGIRFCLGQHGPAPFAATARHTLYNSRKSSVSTVRGEISHQVNSSVWPDRHPLCAIANSVIGRPIHFSAGGRAIAGSERDSINITVEL